MLKYTKRFLSDIRLGSHEFMYRRQENTEWERIEDEALALAAVSASPPLVLRAHLAAQPISVASSFFKKSSDRRAFYVFLPFYRGQFFHRNQDEVSFLPERVGKL